MFALPTTAILGSFAIVDAVALKMGVPTDIIRALDERTPPFVARLADTLALGTPQVMSPAAAAAVVSPDERVIEMTKRVMEDAVTRGPVVVVGRGAQVVLSQHTDAVHVFCYAPRDALIRRIATREGVPSLAAFLRNFVSAEPVKTPESGGLIRTAMTQPAVYFTLDAPFVTIIGLYSNVLEDPGVVSSEGVESSPVDDQQLTFLVNALQQAKKKGGATIVVTHHPPYSGGAAHGGSPKMLADIDAACTKAGYWPHAHLSGHAHNYQRFTRTVNKFDIPYVVCGNGGHGLSPIKGTPRTPVNVNAEVIFENYDATDYGYLRIIVDSKQMRIEFHDEQVGQVFKSPSDAVTVDLASHTMISN